jgi:DNA-binding NarL/FixJ family response regulator
MTTRVAIVDDEPLVRAGLRTIIDSEDDLVVVGETDDGAGVLELAARTEPDVVLMDVRMPQVDGISALRALLARRPDTRVLVVTTFENDDHVLDALAAGAHGFLLKRARPEEIVEAVRVVARGDSLLFPATLRRLAAGRAPSDDLRRDARLTDREAEVLRLVASGRSNQEVADELFLGVETVRTHMGNVLAKLGVRDRTQAVVRAYASGFVTPA